MPPEKFANKVPAIVYILSIILPLVFLTLYFSTGGEYMYTILFNSDILYFPTLYKDLFVDQYHISGWNIPGSPNFFPDMLLYFFFMFITGKASFSMFLFAFIQLLAILLIFRLIIKSVFPSIGEYPLALGNLLLCSFFLIMFIDQDAYMTFHLVSNTYHLGALVNALIAILITIKYIRTSRISQIILLFLFGLIAIISDRLFIIMYCIPVGGTLVIFIRKSHNYKKLLFLFVSIALMILLGFIIFDRISHNKTIHIAKAYFNFSIQGISSSWHVLFTNLLYYFYHLKVFTLFIFICLLSLFLSVWYFFRSFKLIWNGLEIESPEGLKQMMNLLFTLFMVIVFFTPVLTGGFQGFDTIRYNISVFYVGPLYFGTLLICFFNEKPYIKKAVRSLVFASLIVLISFMSYFTIIIKPISGFRNFIEYYPEVSACIDAMDEKYDLKHGVSTYWNGKVGTHFSKRNVRLYTVYDENLVPYSHVGNENWYFETGYGKYDPPVFNFVLLKKPLNESALKTIEQRLGNIIITEDCGNFLFIKVNDFKYMRKNPFPELIDINSPETSE
jgi:hypothetical protein